VLSEEDKAIKAGQAVIKTIEENIRQLKIEYQKALKDYARLKGGHESIFEELEPKYLTLLAKLQKAIKGSTDLWDRSKDSVEELKRVREEKVKYFLTGVIWSTNLLKLDEETKNRLIEQAKDLFYPA